MIYRKVIVISKDWIFLKVNIIKQYKDKVKFQLKNIIIDINDGKNFDCYYRYEVFI